MCACVHVHARVRVCLCMLVYTRVHVSACVCVKGLCQRFRTCLAANISMGIWIWKPCKSQRLCATSLQCCRVHASKLLRGSRSNCPSSCSTTPPHQATSLNPCTQSWKSKASPCQPHPLPHKGDNPGRQGLFGTAGTSGPYAESEGLTGMPGFWPLLQYLHRSQWGMVRAQWQAWPWRSGKASHLVNTGQLGNAMGLRQCWPDRKMMMFIQLLEWRPLGREWQVFKLTQLHSIFSVIRFWVVNDRYTKKPMQKQALLSCGQLTSRIATEG